MWDATSLVMRRDAALTCLVGACAGAVLVVASPRGRAPFGTRTEAVLVDVSVTDGKGRPVTDLTQRDSDPKRFSGEVVVLVRIGGVAGELPRKLSQQYVLGGDLEQLAATRTRRILFFRTPQLAPGEHPVEFAVYDGAARRSSVLRTALRIPAAGQVTIGDLILIDHAEPLGEGESAAGHPLVANQLTLIPAFSATVSKRQRTEINFALSVTADPGASLPDAVLSLFAGRTALSTVTLPIGAADGQGRRLAVGRVPIASIAPGQYELRVTVGAGPDAQVRSAQLVVIE